MASLLHMLLLYNNNYINNNLNETLILTLAIE